MDSIRFLLTNIYMRNKLNNPYRAPVGSFCDARIYIGCRIDTERDGYGYGR